MGNVHAHRGQNLAHLFEALRHFGDLPAGMQVVMLIGAVAVLVLGGQFVWRVIRTVLGR